MEWKNAALAIEKKKEKENEKEILKGVHNLRHTLGRRLRAAGVSNKTRKALLDHANGDITTHYLAVELQELIATAESILNRNIPRRLH